MKLLTSLSFECLLFKSSELFYENNFKEWYSNKVFLISQMKEYFWQDSFGEITCFI